MSFSFLFRTFEEQFRQVRKKRRAFNVKRLSIIENETNQNDIDLFASMKSSGQKRINRMDRKREAENER